MHHFIGLVGLSAVKSCINQLCSSLWHIEWNPRMLLWRGIETRRIYMLSSRWATSQITVWPEAFSGHKKTKQCDLSFPSIAPRRLTNISANICCPHPSLITARCNTQPPVRGHQRKINSILIRKFGLLFQLKEYLRAVRCKRGGRVSPLLYWQLKRSV